MPCRVSSGGHRVHPRPSWSCKTRTYLAVDICIAALILGISYQDGLSAALVHGEAFQIRPPQCTYQAKLEDCRLDIGDPAGCSHCETEDQCFQARICHGQNCSWEPFCEPDVSKAGGSYQDDRPVESERAGGMSTRYKRCGVFKIEIAAPPFVLVSQTHFLQERSWCQSRVEKRIAEAVASKAGPVKHVYMEICLS